MSDSSDSYSSSNRGRMGTKYSKYRTIDVSKAIDNETNDAKSKPPSISSQEKEKNGAFYLDPDGNESNDSLSSRTPSDDKKADKVAQEEASTETDEEALIQQEIKITRVPAEKWREFKTKREVDLSQSILLTSTKRSSSLVFQATRRQRKGPKMNVAVSVEDPEALGQLYVPHRLAINSTYLLRILTECTGTFFTEEKNVLVRPFKYLVEFEEDIREALKTAEEFSQEADAEIYKCVQVSGNEKSEVIDTGKIQAAKKKLEASKPAALRATRQRDELRCLLEFMDQDMSDIFDVKRKIRSQSLDQITFENLWQLYRPGDIVYRAPHGDESRLQAFQILHVTGGRICFNVPNRLEFPMDLVGDKSELDSEDEKKFQDTKVFSGSEMSCFTIDCFYIDSDGVSLAPKGKRFVISPYREAMPIVSLEPQSLSFSPQMQQIQMELVERGAHFSRLSSPESSKHMVYSGTTIKESSAGILSRPEVFLTKAIEIHGEVIVDQESAVKHFQETFHGWSLKLRGGVIQNPTKANLREVFDFFLVKGDKNTGEWVNDVFDDAIFEENRRKEFLDATEIVTSHKIGTAAIPNYMLRLLPPRMYGYSLLDRRWVAFNITLLQDLSANRAQGSSSKLEDLVLPNGHKIILRALITNQIPPSLNGSNESDNLRGDFSMDVVPAKGNGLIILLHGAPGVGKTSTAECIAVELNRPLLTITCGDIGTTSNEAKTNLETFCTLAHRWGCVLLLDEADIFLVKRERGDIKRNSLVSVFLRVLDYFSGVIILTTNRVGDLDQAFRSRVNICLYYPELSRSQAQEIWEKHIQRIKNSDWKIDIEENEIKRFAAKIWEEKMGTPIQYWNGRQIKNAFQTAIALARWEFYEEGNVLKRDRPFVTVKHFRPVTDITANFNDYADAANGICEEDAWGTLAERDGVRKDSSSAVAPQPRSLPEGPEIDRQKRNYRSPSKTRPRGQAEYGTFGDQDKDDSDEFAKAEN